VLYRVVLAVLCVLLASPSGQARAGALVDFVRGFAFTEANSVDRLPYSDEAVAALRSALSDADMPANFRCQRVVDGGKGFLLVYSPDIAGARSLL